MTLIDIAARLTGYVTKLCKEPISHVNIAFIWHLRVARHIFVEEKQVVVFEKFRGSEIFVVLLKLNKLLPSNSKNSLVNLV